MARKQPDNPVQRVNEWLDQLDNLYEVMEQRLAELKPGLFAGRKARSAHSSLRKIIRGLREAQKIRTDFNLAISQARAEGQKATGQVEDKSERRRNG